MFGRKARSDPLEAMLQTRDDLEALAKSQPPPAAPEVGDFWADQSLERLRWVVPALAAAGGVVVAFNAGLSGPFAVMGWLGLVWSVVWIASTLLAGPERIEVDRIAHSVTLKRKRAWGDQTRTWRFDEIAGYDLHEEEGRALRDSGSGISSDRSRTPTYWIGMRLTDGSTAKLFYKRYRCCFDSSEMSRRRVLLETMTGKPRAPRAHGL